MNSGRLPISDKQDFDQQVEIAVNEVDIDMWLEEAELKLELRTRFEKQNAKNIREE